MTDTEPPDVADEPGRWLLGADEVAGMLERGELERSVRRRTMLTFSSVKPKDTCWPLRRWSSRILRLPTTSCTTPPGWR